MEPLLEEGLWVVGLPSTGLARDKPVTLRELACHPLILPGAAHGLRNLVEHVATLMDLQLNVVAETNAMSVQKSLVLGGHGLTVLPAIATVDDIAHCLLAAAPLTEPALTRRIVLALPTHRQTTAPVRCVVSALVQCMKEAAQCGNWTGAQWRGD